MSLLPESNQWPYDNHVVLLQSYALPTELSRGDEKMMELKYIKFIVIVSHSFCDVRLWSKRKLTLRVWYLMFNMFRSFNQLINHGNYLYIIMKILCIYNSISYYYSVDDVIILYSKPDTSIHADRYFIRKMPVVQLKSY